MRVLRLLSLALIAWSFAMIVRALPYLPARIPMHFDRAGRPNGWGSSQDLWHMLFMQILATVLVLAMPLLGHIGSLAQKYARDASDAARARRERILPVVAQLSSLICLLINGIFTYAIRGIIAAAQEPGRGLPPPPFWVVLAVFASLVVYAIWKVSLPARQS